MSDRKEKTRMCCVEFRNTLFEAYNNRSAKDMEELLDIENENFPDCKDCFRVCSIRDQVLGILNAVDKCEPKKECFENYNQINLVIDNEYLTRKIRIKALKALINNFKQCHRYPFSCEYTNFIESINLVISVTNSYHYRKFEKLLKKSIQDAMVFLTKKIQFDDINPTLVNIITQRLENRIKNNEDFPRFIQITNCKN